MGWWHLVVFAIFVAALALQVYAAIPSTSFGAGVVPFAAALVTEQHIDTVVDGCFNIFFNPSPILFTERFYIVLNNNPVCVEPLCVDKRLLR